LAAADPEAAALVAREMIRESSTIEMIASENFVPTCIMQVPGSVLTNKYAEGYPGKRYHGGCEVIDEIESLAIERARKLFGADHANLQPHSGVNANLAVYMDLLHEGTFPTEARSASPESTTGPSHTASTGEHKPRMIVADCSAYSRVTDFERFRKIADSVGALLLADMVHIAGLVAAGLHPSPVPCGDAVTSTTTKTLRGARGGFILCRKEHS